MKLIDSFQGDFRFLSNFWPAKVKLDGIEYPTVEHAYMAAKTLDPIIRSKVQKLTTAGAAKRFCKTVQLRADWESVKVSVMLDLLQQKFSVEPLKSLLLSTGEAELVEGNTWGDVFWGVCKGKGLNTLGKLLMQVRKEMQ